MLPFMEYTGFMNSTNLNTIYVESNKKDKKEMSLFCGIMDAQCSCYNSLTYQVL